jgi:hypothetical protein
MSLATMKVVPSGTVRLETSGREPQDSGTTPVAVKVTVGEVGSAAHAHGLRMMRPRTAAATTARSGADLRISAPTIQECAW